MPTSAPSAASSSAIARPSPLLAAVTIATLPPSPRFMLASQVGVALVEPVLSRRTEDVDVECILQRLRLVRHIGWDVQHLAGADDDFLLLIFADPESQCTFEDVRQLLVLVRVLGNDATLLEIHVSEHHAVAGDELAIEQIRHLLSRKIFPSIEGDVARRRCG